VLVRFHKPNIIDDVESGGSSTGKVRRALERIKAEGRGVLVYLRDGAAGVPVTPLGKDELRTRDDDRRHQWREVGVGAQILRDLGVRSIRNLSASEHAYLGLSGFGIEITGNESFE
jgi:3,4-dihydroxy 2-butanone 4-phosphate synthase/GTP cyclohydrolase II